MPRLIRAPPAAKISRPSSLNPSRNSVSRVPTKYNHVHQNPPSSPSCGPARRRRHTGSGEGRAQRRVDAREGPERPPHPGLGNSWAVAEHARRANAVLRFGKVTTAQELQVVAEVSYRLFLDAADADGNVANYGAVVYEDDRTNTRELTSFARADDVTGTAGPRLD